MDRFLFRGKRLDNGELTIGFFDVITKGAYLDPIENGYYITTFKKLENGEIILTGRFEVDPATVGQCTGLKDLNSVDIFGGDIAKDSYDRIMRVEFSVHFQQTRLFPISENCSTILNMSKEYGCEIFSWTYPEMHLEVIGNIYENPELLNHAPQE